MKLDLVVLSDQKKQVKKQKVADSIWVFFKKKSKKSRTFPYARCLGNLKNLVGMLNCESYNVSLGTSSQVLCNKSHDGQVYEKKTGLEGEINPWLGKNKSMI